MVSSMGIPVATSIRYGVCVTIPGTFPVQIRPRGGSDERNTRSSSVILGTSSFSGARMVPRFGKIYAEFSPSPSNT